MTAVMNHPTPIGAFTGVAVAYRAPMAELCTGFDQHGRPVTIVALTAEAGRDPNWCAQFADAVNRADSEIGPMESAIKLVDLYAPRPYAASHPEAGRRGAERLLSALPGALPQGVDPSDLVPQSGVVTTLNAAAQPAVQPTHLRRAHR